VVRAVGVRLKTQVNTFGNWLQATTRRLRRYLFIGLNALFVAIARDTGAGYKSLVPGVDLLEHYPLIGFEHLNGLPVRWSSVVTMLRMKQISSSMPQGCRPCSIAHNPEFLNRVAFIKAQY
jgi:hypothetical protein